MKRVRAAEPKRCETKRSEAYVYVYVNVYSGYAWSRRVGDVDVDVDIDEYVCLVCYIFVHGFWKRFFRREFFVDDCLYWRGEGGRGKGRRERNRFEDGGPCYLREENQEERRRERE